MYEKPRSLAVSFIEYASFVSTLDVVGAGVGAGVWI
jgi:hypothetical protein